MTTDMILCPILSKGGAMTLDNSLYDLEMDDRKLSASPDR